MSEGRERVIFVEECRVYRLGSHRVVVIVKGAISQAVFKISIRAVSYVCNDKSAQ